MAEPRFVRAVMDFAHWCKGVPPLMFPLIVGNAIAVYWGYTEFYGFQLSQTAWYLRPFVADSPNAVGALVLAVLLYQFGRSRWVALDLLAWAWNIKVGLWTVFVLLNEYEYFFTSRPDESTLRWWLLVLHAGMVFQAFLLYRDMTRTRVAWGWLAGLAGFVLLGDWLDYVVGIHPPAGPRGMDHGPIAIVTVTLSLAVTLLAVLLYAPRPATSMAPTPPPEAEPPRKRYLPDPPRRRRGTRRGTARPSRPRTPGGRRQRTG